MSRRPAREPSGPASGAGAPAPPSAPPSPGPAAQAPASATPAPPPPAPAPAPPRRRRLGLWITLVVVLAIAARIVALQMLPGIVSRTAARYGLLCTYERLHLTLLSLDLELVHLVVTPDAPDARPAVRAEYLRADLSLWALLHGELLAQRVVVDGLAVDLERAADGRITLFEHIAAHVQAAADEAGTPGAPAAPQAPAADLALAADRDEPPAPLELAAPFAIEALRIDALSLRWRDASVSPPLEARLEADLRLSDVGSARRGAQLALRLSAEPVLELLELQATATPDDEGQVALELMAGVRGLRRAVAADYLDAIGLALDGERASLGFALDVQTRPPTQPGALLAGRAALRPAALLVDDVERFGLDELIVDADGIGAQRIDLREVVLVGLRSDLVATEDLDFIAGLGFTGGAEPGPETAPEPPGAAPALHVGEVRLEQVRVELVDERLAPPVRLPLHLDSLRLADVDLPLPPDAQRDATLDARLRAPGVVEQLVLVGAARPRGTDGSFQLELAASGITGAALAASLERAGIAPVLANGTLGARLEAGWSTGPDGALVASGALTDLALADGGELLAVDALAVDAVAVAADGSSIDVGTVTVDGTRVAVQLDDGVLSVAGLRFEPGPRAVDTEPSDGLAPAGGREGGVEAGSVGDTAAGPPADTAPDPSAAGTGASSAPGEGVRVTLDELAWRGIELAAAVRRGDLARTVAVHASAEVERLATGAAALPDVERAQLALASPGAVEELLVSAATRGGGGDSTARIGLRGRGLQGAGLSELLAPFGIAPRWRDGALRLDGEVALGDDGSLSVRLSDLQLSDGRAATGRDGGDGTSTGGGGGGIEQGGDSDRATLAAFSALDLSSTAGAGGGTQLDVALREPLVAVTRTEGGELRVAEIAMVGAAAGDGAPAAPEAAPSPGEATPGTGAASGAAPAGRSASSPADAVALDARLEQLTIRWTDDQLAPPVHSDVVLDARLDDLLLGGAPAEPASAELSVRLPESGAHFDVSGSLALAADAPRAELRLTAGAAGAGPLARYLPPSVSLDAAPRSLSAAIELAAPPAADGGHALELDVSAVDYRADGAAQSWLALGRLHVLAPRLDPTAQHYDVEHVRLEGLEVEATAHADGGLTLLGVRLAPPSTEDGSAPAAEPLASAEQAGGLHRAPAPAGAQLAALPHVRLGELDLELARLELRHESAPAAPPLRGELRVALEEPFELGAAEPTDSAHLGLRLDGRVPGLVEHLAVALAAAPLAPEPHARLALDVTGIDGAELARLRPDLADTVDAAALRDGRLHAEVEAVLGGMRPGPLSFGLDGAELRVAGLAWREGDGPVLLGLDELHVEVERSHPGELRLGEVDLDRPIAHVRRSSDGFSVGALRFPTPAAAAAADGGAPGPVETPLYGTPAAPVTPPGEVEGAADEAPDAPRRDVTIQRLLVGGIDASYADTTTTPPLRVAVGGLDVEVTGLSTRLMTEPVSVRYQVLVEGAPWPRDADAGGAAGDAAGSTGTAAGDAATHERATPGRRAATSVARWFGMGADDTAVNASWEAPLFDEIELGGRLQLTPHPRGTTRTSLRSVDLAGLAGPAAGAGVELHGGWLDATVDARLQDDGTLHTNSRFLFTDLAVAEPPDGPIARTLRLPTPLGTALFVLRDEHGIIDIPLEFTLPAAGLSMGQVTSTALGVLGRLILDAVANSPFRIAGTITGVAGDVGAMAGQVTQMVGLDALASAARLDDLAGMTGIDRLAELPGVSRLFGAEAEPLAVSALAFRPGDVALPAQTRAHLDELAARLANEERLAVRLAHEFGLGDLRVAAVLANPPTETARELVTRLRRRRDDLTETRVGLSGELGASLAANLGEQADVLARRLHDLDEDLARTERALDATLELLRPEAERRAPRRTRQAALDIAAARLGLVRDELLARAGPGIAERVSIARPRYGDPPHDEGGQVTVAVIPWQPQHKSWWSRATGWIGNLFGSDDEQPAGAGPDAPRPR